MTIVSDYDSNGRKYYRSTNGGPIYYVADFGEAGAREMARRAERSVISREYDFTKWTSKME